MKRRFRVDAARKNNAQLVGTDTEHWYVKDKLGKVSMMLDDADQKLAYAQKMYDQNAATEDHPDSDFNEGASKAIDYSRKQINFIDDRIEDYLEDYNLKWL